jgi:hypothetical protein
VRSRLPLVAMALAALAACRASTPSRPSPQIERLALFYPRNGMGPIAVDAFAPQLNLYSVDSDGVYEALAGGLSELVWSSSNPAVLTVSGRPPAVRGVAPGTADLRVTYKGLTATSPITVANKTPPYLDIFVSIGPGTVLGEKGTASIWLNGTTSVSIASATWTSLTPEIATVSNGVVTSVRPGNAEIAATWNGVSGSTRFSVPPRQY